MIETDQGAFFYAQIFGSSRRSALRGNVRGARTRQLPVALLKLLATTHTDHLRWSLPAHRRGTLRGMDAA
ncbi:hypothetical protein [Xanthomonas arboricola]|uniref:hypothetical protein n=1 Tax=Xanthomonas arboricola TaxID=56448 RepID=UPI0004B2F4C6|nr:hypothetical protein [Xanthomonas arboricola]NJC02356.1 hypothetical protein [Xanthomonas arboricola]